MFHKYLATRGIYFDLVVFTIGLTTVAPQTSTVFVELAIRGIGFCLAETIIGLTVGSPYRVSRETF